MKVIKKILELKKTLKNNPDVGFVPTMGGLHKGHVSLLKESKKLCKKTLISIYVNSKQFNNKIDYNKYPRNIKKDLNLLKKLKIDFIFIPSSNELNSINIPKKIKLKKSEKILCAKFRKGHFEGVLDVMSRFMKIIKAKYIFMGQKDFQQLYLIKKYLQQRYKNTIVICKTIRDNNYAALSTRNQLLSKKEILSAGNIAKYLKKQKKIIKKKYLVNNYMSLFINKLEKKFNIKIEYLELRNKKNLKNVNKFSKKYGLFFAYYINKIRLIDNL